MPSRPWQGGLEGQHEPGGERVGDRDATVWRIHGAGGGPCHGDPDEVGDTGDRILGLVPGDDRDEARALGRCYCRVSVTRANGRRTPALSLSMCHCQESVTGSDTNVV